MTTNADTSILDPTPCPYGKDTRIEVIAGKFKGRTGKVKRAGKLIEAYCTVILDKLPTERQQRTEFLEWRNLEAERTHIDLREVESPVMDNRPMQSGKRAPCLLCGRALTSKGKRYWVHLTTSGMLTNLPDDLVPDSQGSFEIGSDCAKRLPTSFVTVDPLRQPA